MKLKVNGEDRDLPGCTPDTPLLWALRDEAGLTGTKYGCGRSLCGACTVHVGGTPTRSCVLPSGLVGGREVTTIEGLPDGDDHPLRQAWLELDVAQCWGRSRSGRYCRTWPGRCPRRPGPGSWRAARRRS